MYGPPRRKYGSVVKSQSFVSTQSNETSSRASGLGVTGLPPIKSTGNVHVATQQPTHSTHLPHISPVRPDTAQINSVQVEQMFEPTPPKASLSITNPLPVYAPARQIHKESHGRPPSEASNGSGSTGNRSSTSRAKDRGLTSDQALRLYGGKLTEYEQQEILNYPQIYFVGQNAKKKQGIIGSPLNCGYDDEHGSYIDVPHDHVAYRFEVLKLLGKGSFGQVMKVYDHKSQIHIALKMVRNEKRFHRQAQEEIRILDHLRKHDKDSSHNLVHMLDSFQFRNHVCMTFELLSMNLYELIKKNKFQGFSIGLVRKFAHSILQCLDLLFRHRIIHCDMKPENVLLKQPGRSGIKVSLSFVEYTIQLNCLTFHIQLVRARAVIQCLSGYNNEKYMTHEIYTKSVFTSHYFRNTVRR
ncbi:Dual specificity tyrosine-phosphorylation-regulated kinase 2-like [Oopsacas minuta]|uniref:dual-specificity kinase n=1 Tax=Oopsacas minuta TaxID=111878 RepID=A0AAV7K3U1_9METZ|nr:Dual specificity tyrosine-phosphorylation-regulated kinase 2-like [Oopsacas minuta]